MVRTTLRATAVLSLAALSAICLYVVICGSLLVWQGSHDSAGRADAIVVMGAAQYDGTPSPLLERRLHHALDLWREGRAPLIAVTGGKKAGDRFTEAGSSRRWLVARGVPDASIVSEDRGTSTWESLVALAPVLRRDSARSVIAVSSPWHVERVVQSLRQLGFSADGSPAIGLNGGASGLGWLADRTAQIRTLKEIVGVSIGRIIGFGRLYDLTG